MGTCYKGACHDCQEYVDLDKFYSFCPSPNVGDLEMEDLSEYGEHFIYNALRLHLFMGHHRGHRIGVYSETEPGGQAIEEYAEVFPRPQMATHETEVIDLRDCKTPRIVLKTRHGDLYLDTFSRTVNCFRFIGGKRIDTILLEKGLSSASQGWASTQEASNATYYWPGTVSALRHVQVAAPVTARAVAEGYAHANVVCGLCSQSPHNYPVAQRAGLSATDDH